MQPEELLRAAAKIISQHGWCQGDGEQIAIHARDHNGEPVLVYRPATDGDSRVSINPNAATFSIYGALVRAMAEAGTAIANPGLLWDTLYRVAKAQNRVPHGGNNYVHPLIQFNETRGRTKESVLTFMEDCAKAIERDRVAA